ncbi:MULTISPECIES: 5-methyltetrahydropteroyltriglutamate--homocysteine S-methyltransferase [Olivibacter]|jgi:5-methyltetrahydropteroyltriglutamate--homocysteine methyltransferase|uniref:5-methyltetrahydropteroyltriglutamate--homocysteine methyltransferase n=2 Tax=Olivibacter TaxID=376469 RepID=A0ABV6HR97_9SPHI|nr:MULTISPECIES: 5-methyltetrahydropteroyltriglutamate--homocysteine S-methyltransferase [Olivibacter]MCL4638180.1 5-methyltetrahydropteroyltriglutamate--homocysteine S-methyltransferase [Olivibacter sp. UJ_SKK_5.1]MDM8173961.1 5-methyltetrahydropteroyltriglutamate--homocysteine S-methyltransferase [Olivibacter sp. 47]MDX3915146.1 5-methyltetrahydropteroyltriglutamate--homocysteine S-methyltransferase [Pseudosphingobacterium sp.]QEL03748.1 5-methyltetrahydropteroyltriglutamate--homocysteine S-m
MLFTNNLGYPRIGAQRELKKASEAFWSGKITRKELLDAGLKIRATNWKIQKEIGIDLIPSNDFSFYDQVLDTTLMVGAIPARYHGLAANKSSEHELDLYFAMARGFQHEGIDVTAMEMTKWFDTNYHYLVPEFTKNQQFSLFSEKIINEYYEAKQLGVDTKPVLIGPITYLLLGKEKEAGFDRLDLIEALLPVYEEVIGRLRKYGVKWIQFDEPFLALDLPDKARKLYQQVYKRLAKSAGDTKLLIATYFEGVNDNLEVALSLPINALHLDLVRAANQLEAVLDNIPNELILSLGVVDGRNIWKNDYERSLTLIDKAIRKIGKERIWIAPSCSLLHVPCDLAYEDNEETLPLEVKDWLAFAKQKLEEVKDLALLRSEYEDTAVLQRFKDNKVSQNRRKTSALIHHQEVKDRVNAISDKDTNRRSVFAERKAKQLETLNLPLYPTTTIGSFPQTKEVRGWRAKFKKGEITIDEYENLIRAETKEAIAWQEQVGLDVLVHGEFERNDMVEYFGEQLQGYAFTKNGWVQSYGSRCVKPPVLFGDVSRPKDMTVYWTSYAQSITRLPVKGMLTGPVTILQWSFVRDDQPRWQTAFQIALAIRDEVLALEHAGIKIIQIDEPAIREGLPLRQKDQRDYLNWAVKAFRLTAAGVEDDTQIHTHMCYSEFNDIISDIAAMDADVITIETSRSQMELLDAFANFNYPNDIGPGVYDIHSPRIPSKEEMISLMDKASAVINPKQLWVNPDCGLKTRAWPETKAALEAMVDAAKTLRGVIEVV